MDKCPTTEKFYIGMKQTQSRIKIVPTDSLIEGSGNLFYNHTRFDTRLVTNPTDDLSNEGL